MKIVFISNYINHHQIPFSDALYSQPGTEYYFIQTQPMEKERIDMGWGLDASAIPYVLFLYEQEEFCKKLIQEADLLLVGWMEREDLLTERLGSGKLTLRISERLYRDGQWKAISPRGLVRKYKEHTKYRKKSVYLLCAGAYTASDFHLVHAYPDKMFRFGYFPKTRTYEGNALWEKKREDVVDLVWAARMIPLKHPEFAVKLAKKLKEEAYPFHLHFVGDGDLFPEIEKQVEEAGLKEYVTLYGFLKPDEVRDVMEKCSIHLFTSNYLEGWGAVVNEAMNSGCVPVINSQVGSAPYLIEEGVTGLTYHNGSCEDFEKQVIYLLKNPEKRREMQKAAHELIIKEWNAEVAAARCIDFYENWKKGDIKLPERGPLSKAPIIRPDWI